LIAYAVATNIKFNDKIGWYWLIQQQGLDKETYTVFFGALKISNKHK
jgi:hypothetical protein